METYRRQFGRRYDREFKENAVALVQSGRTVREVARDLGVSQWSLNRWVKDAEAGKILSQPRVLADDLGSRMINPRWMLKQRALMVDAMYAATPGMDVLDVAEQSASCRQRASLETGPVTSDTAEKFIKKITDIP